MSEAYIEILVHSAAPTSKSEDDKIRAQALSILGFMPEKRTHITSLTFPKRGDLVQRELRALKKHGEEPSSSESGDSYEILLKHSAESSAEQYVIPGLLSPLIDYEGGIPPLPTTSTPEDIAQNPSSVESHGLLSLDEDGVESDSSYATSRFDSWESPPASIPDSQPPLPSDPFAVPAARAEGAYTDETEVTVFPALPGVSFCYNQPPTTSTLTPLSPRHQSSLGVSDYSLSSLHSNFASPSVQNNNPKSPPLRTLLAADGAYELISPPPDTNSSPVLITPQLREMTDVGDLLVGKYQKLKRGQTRELRTWERGHWRVDMSTWESPNKKINFWNILKDNVEHGRLGPVNAFLEGTGDVVKVYCHGGMVEHLWCALFVMSSRNSRNATWIDAGDNEIVVF
ncbi:hypothetical protein P167DRAFT_601452 [Morchella conica CCBAS932]|uniref:Uncharacterized protein n=1 Tax=Morchella conica CCBAS932 TaxID=1392247 RepID=A0A3N4L487_9PEZI|nr:hypothetical protein P167DRAFT_601452 [Morchella conica CCBAS932]